MFGFLLQKLNALSEADHEAENGSSSSNTKPMASCLHALKERDQSQILVPEAGYITCDTAAISPILRPFDRQCSTGHDRDAHESSIHQML